MRRAVQHLPVGLQHAAQTPGRDPQLVDGVGRVAADPQLFGGEPVDLAADVVHEHRAGRCPSGPRAAGREGAACRSSSAGGRGRAGAHAGLAARGRRRRRSRSSSASPGRRSISDHARTSARRPIVATRDVVVDERGEQPVVRGRAAGSPCAPCGCSRRGASAASRVAARTSSANSAGTSAPSPAGTRRVSSGRSSRQWAGADGGRCSPSVMPAAASRRSSVS